MKNFFVITLLTIAIIFVGENNSEAAHIAAYAEAIVINVSDCVNLREEPSTNSAILAKIPLGSTVKVHAEYIKQNGFFSVIYQGIHGYIYKNYLSVPDWAK